MLLWPLAWRRRAWKSFPHGLQRRLHAVFAVRVSPICRSVRRLRLDSRWRETRRSQGVHSTTIEPAADFVGQDVAFDFQRRRPGEIFSPEHVTADAFVGQKPLIAKLDFPAHRAICVLHWIRMHDEY